MEHFTGILKNTIKRLSTLILGATVPAGCCLATRAKSPMAAGLSEAHLVLAITGATQVVVAISRPPS